MQKAFLDLFIQIGNDAFSISLGPTTLYGTGKPYSGYPNFNCPDEIVDGAKNAALLAIQIMAVTDETLAAKLDAAREEGKDAVLKADAELPKELDRRLRINENVMRHIIVCQDEE